MPLVGGSTSRERALVSFCALLVFAGCAHGRPTRVEQQARATALAPAKAGTLRPAVEPSAPPAGAAPGEALNAPSAPAPATSAQTADATQILSVRTSPSVVHAGESITWDVRTTADIVAVTAHVSAYTIPLKRTRPGHFGLSFTVPSNVPAFFHGTYNLDVTGETTRGATAKRTVSMTFQ